VKYGNPSNKFLPKWTPVEGTNRSTMIVDREPRNVQDPDSKLVELFAKYGPKFQPKLSHTKE